MKKQCISIIFLVLSISGFCQDGSTDIAMENIVPNPGFERYSRTPIGWFYNGKHFTDIMKYWDSATSASPDVFGPKVRVPATWAEKGFGKQKPHDGESMAGSHQRGPGMAGEEAPK